METNQTNSYTIDVEGLYVIYDKGVTALKDVSFKISRGEFVGLAGPDGSGKTSLLKVMVGLIRPNKGKVVVLGEKMPQGLNRLKRRVGFLPQKFSLYPDLTVDENIYFFGKAFGVKDLEAKRENLLEFTGLIGFRRRLAEYLSGGMKQKLALACTLIHSPELLVLDEPTGGVDPVSRREFFEILGELSRKGVTIVMATPYLDEAERCHKTLLLHQGQILSLGSMEDLRNLVKWHTYEIRCQPLRLGLDILKGKHFVKTVHMYGEYIHVFTEDILSQEEMRKTLGSGGVGLLSMHEIKPRLEDIFVSLIKDYGR